MTTQGMLNWFNLLQDKYGSLYYTEAEQLQFLNQAVFQYLSEVLPDNEGGKENLEVDSNVFYNISPLVYELSVETMDNTGLITNSDIRTNLQTVSGDATADIFRILSIEYKRGGQRFPADFMRHNDKAEFEQNYFKKPSFTAPKYTFQNSGIQFRPIDEQASIYITVLKTPKALSVSPESNPELHVKTHNEIVAIGLEFAGIASRDEVLLTLNKVQLPQ